jgi:glucokinase
MYSIGIDLGGTNIAVGIVDAEYRIVKKESIPTRAKRTADEITADIAALCLKLMGELGLSAADVEFAGMATPGTANSVSGVIEYANNLPFYMYPMCEKLSALLGGIKVYIENDANAAAKAEAMAGAAKGSRYSVMITLGTGGGGGIILEGKVYAGFNFAGAELGHTVIEKDGRQCSCGRRGCWETYSSATGLIRTTEEKMAECREKNIPTLMQTLADERGKVTGRTAFDALRMGDKAAEEVVDEYTHYLASGIASIIDIFQPEVLSIGGGISNEGDFLLDRLIPTVRQEQYGTGLLPETDIRIAKLRNDAGIIGAAVLGM